MTLRLLAFERADEAPTPLDDIVNAFSDEVGCSIDGHDGASYRPWRWRDPATGAQCFGDIGLPPLEADPMSRERDYPGWRPISLEIQIPIGIAHWHCVESSRLIERVLARLPGAAILNCEDTGDGPGPIDRVAILASWEQLHTAHIAGRSDCWRMDRHESLAVWRYRAECTKGRETHPELLWPGALALLDDTRACSASPLMSHCSLKIHSL